MNGQDTYAVSESGAVAHKSQVGLQTLIERLEEVVSASRYLAGQCAGAASYINHGAHSEGSEKISGNSPTPSGPLDQMDTLIDALRDNHLEIESALGRITSRF